MITDKDDSFPYFVTTADQLAGQQALANPDPNPLMVYSETPPAPATPPMPLRHKIRMFAIALLGVGFFVFLRLEFGDWESQLHVRPLRFELPFFIGLAFSVLGIGGFSYRIRVKVAPEGEMFKQYADRFLLTEHGLVIHRQHLREFRAWRQFKDYRDSGEVLVVLYKDEPGHFLIPLRDVPADRREEFRQHLRNALGGKAP